MRNSSAPESKGLGGCVLGCGIALLIGLVLVVVIPWWVIFHTSVPLSFVANEINKSGAGEIEGLEGRIGGNLSLTRARFGDEPDAQFSMEGLDLRWNGLTDMMFRNRLLVENFTIESMHLILPEESVKKTTASTASTEESEEEPKSETTSHSFSSSSSGDLGQLEIRQMALSNLVLEQRGVNGFRTVIDRIELRGLKAQGDRFDLADFNVAAPGLEVHLEDTSPVELGGRRLPLSRMLVASVTSELHPYVLKPADARVEFGVENDELSSRARLLGDTVEWVMNGAIQSGSGNGQLNVRKLTAADWFDPRLIDLPAELTLDLAFDSRETDQGVTHLKEGSFSIGQASFTIAPATFNDAEDEVVITGRASHAGLELVAHIEPAEAPPYLRTRLEPVAGKSGPEVMALLLHGRPLPDLSAAEAEAVRELAARRFSSATTDVPSPPEKTPSDPPPPQ